LSPTTVHPSLHFSPSSTTHGWPIRAPALPFITNKQHQRKPISKSSPNTAPNEPNSQHP
jgi:hypothetical protein